MIPLPRLSGCFQLLTNICSTFFKNPRKKENLEPSVSCKLEGMQTIAAKAMLIVSSKNIQSSLPQHSRLSKAGKQLALPRDWLYHLPIVLIHVILPQIIVITIALARKYKNKSAIKNTRVKMASKWPLLQRRRVLYNARSVSVKIVTHQVARKLSVIGTSTKKVQGSARATLGLICDHTSSLTISSVKISLVFDKRFSNQRSQKPKTSIYFCNQKPSTRHSRDQRKR
jgi:hypothetical protein